MKVPRSSLLEKLNMLRPLEDASLIRLNKNRGIACASGLVAEAILHKDLDFPPTTTYIDHLINVLQNMDADEVDISVEGNEVRLAGGNVRAGIKTLEFVEGIVPEISKPVKVDLPDDFWKKVAIAKSVASKNPFWYTLMHLHITNEFVEATDNVRFVRAYFSEPIEGAKFEFLIEAKVLERLVPIAPQLLVYSQKDNRWVCFRGSGLRCFCALYDATYMQGFDEILAMEPNFVFGSDETKILRQALAKGYRFCKSKVDKGYSTIMVEGDKMIVRAEGDYGWFEETFQLDNDLGNFTLSLTLDQLNHVVKLDFDRVSFLGDRIKLESEGVQFLIDLE